MHFGYDPGADYDWSRFPEIRPVEPVSSMAGRSRSEFTHTPIVLNGDDTIELSRDERMFLIQKYLDIVKLELFDPGPASVKRMAHLATNSSGMRVNIANVNVSPPNLYTSNPVHKNESNKVGKTIKQKFFNIFKKV